MIAKQLDGKLMQLARRYHLTFTRYVDDLSFSTTKATFPSELIECSGTPLDADKIILHPLFDNVFLSSGFNINARKTRLYSKGVRQEVTGLTVNEFVNVRRRFIRQIRAMIHSARKFGFDNAGLEYLKKYAPPERRSAEVRAGEGFDPGMYFKLVIYGKLAFLRMVRGKTDKCYVNLCLKISDIDPNPPSQIVEIKKMHEEFDVFICHASEDKAAIATPLFEALKGIGVVAFIDEEYIKWGDSFVEKINHALSRAKVVVVILSNNSVNKRWPKKELNASLAREISGRTKVLPLMVGSSSEIEHLLDELPLLKDKLYKTWKSDAHKVAQEIKKVLP